jgi:hypothetical protein
VSDVRNSDQFPDMETRYHVSTGSDGKTIYEGTSEEDAHAAALLHSSHGSFGTAEIRSEGRKVATYWNGKLDWSTSE